MKNRIEDFISKEPSKWMEDAKYYEENHNWLDKSARIALRILRAKKITQKQLAKLIDVTPQYVNKLVKGNQNLTLETICKIEDVLNIELIQVPSFESLIVIPEEWLGEISHITSRESKTFSKDKFEYNPDLATPFEIFEEAA